MSILSEIGRQIAGAGTELVNRLPLNTNQTIGSITAAVVSGLEVISQPRGERLRTLGRSLFVGAVCVGALYGACNFVDRVMTARSQAFNREGTGILLSTPSGERELTREQAHLLTIILLQHNDRLLQDNLMLRERGSHLAQEITTLRALVTTLQNQQPYVVVSQTLNPM